MRPAVIMVSGRAWGSYLAIMRSLGRRGVPVHVVSWGVEQDILRASRYYTAGVALPAASGADRLAALTEYAQRIGAEGRPVLYYCTDEDAAFAADNRQALDARFIVLMGDADGCRMLMGKDTVDALARRSGLQVPGTWHVSATEALDAYAGEFRYPVVLKPCNWNSGGGVSIKADIIFSWEALRERAAAVLHGGGEVVVQDYIEGGDESVEFFLFYRSLDGARLHGCTGRKLRQFPPGAGIMALGMTDAIADLRSAGEAFISAVDYRGLGGVEFKRGNGGLYFIEMSTRSEMFHKIAMDAGVDLPWIAYADACGIDAGNISEQRDGVLYVNEVPYLLVVARKPSYFLQDCRRMLKGPLRLGMFAADDVKPFFLKIASSLRRVMNRTPGR
ncbi:carboxylate--amine ligase [Desulfovibrio psychrotolerans]|nr:hypothetical protein [Desulfovibrio psychrotolerans]